MRGLPDVLEGAVILVFADDWGVHPSSSQHLFKRLLATNRVIWFNTVGLRWPRLNLYDFRKLQRKVCHWIGGNQSVVDCDSRPEIHDIPLLPLSLGRPARNLNAWILRRAMRRCLTDRDSKPLLDRSGSQPGVPVFIVSTLPLTADLVGKVPGATFIYYLVDDYASWPGLTGKLVRQMDREQARAADRVVAASRALAGLHQEVADRIDYLPHGVDVDHFAIGRQVRAQRKQDGTKPIADVIFFGAVDERI